MAEVPVRSKEIIEDGLFAPTIASGKELETVLESLKISFAKITKETKAIAKSNNAFGSAAQVNEYTAALEKQQAVRKVVQKTEEQLIKQKERERLAEIRLAQQREKAFDRNVKKIDAENSAYNKLAKTVNNLRKQYKDVAVAQGENSKSAKLLLAQLTPLDAKLKQIDANAGQFQRNVGNYPRVFGLAANAVKSLASAFGIFIGFRAVAGVFREALRGVKDFDQGVISVAKTTGIQGEELEKLKLGIIALSNELANVDTSKLLEYGSVAGQLGVKGTENILAFAESLAMLETASDITGEEGGKAIARLLTLTDGGTQNIKAFGDEIVNLGNNFAASENEILGNATQIAQNTGVYKLARQEVLAYATATKAVGIESELTGSTIGRTLAIFENAIRTGKGLKAITDLTGKSQEELNKQFKANSGSVLTDFITGLNKVSESGGSVNQQLELIGINSVRDQRVIGSLATAGFRTLTRSLEEVSNATGSLEKEFEDASQSINNFYTRFTVSFTNLILSVDKGDGAFSNLLKSILGVGTELLRMAAGTEKAKSELNEYQLGIRNVAENLVLMTKVIGSVLAGYAAFRVSLVATNMLLKLSNILTISLGSVKRAYVTITNLATAAQNKFNAAQKANVIGVVVGLLVTLITFMRSYKTATDEATEAQKRFNDEQRRQADAIRSIEERLKIAKSLSKDGLEQLRSDIQEEITLINKKEDEANIIAQREGEKLLELRKKFANARTKLEKIGAFTAIQLEENRIQNITKFGKEQLERRKMLIKALLDLERFNVEEKTKITTEGNKDEIISYEKEVRDSIIRQLEDEEVRRKETARAAFKDKIESLRKEGKFRNELEIELRKELDAELLKITKEYQDKRAELEKARLAKFKSEQEMYYDAEIIELETQLLQIEDVTTQDYKDLQAKILKLKTEQLERELEEVRNNADLSNAERYKREQEILFEIATLNKTTKEKEIKKERDYLKQGTDALQATLEERNNLRQRYYDLETQERDRQIQIQSDRAAAGITNQLAFEEAQQKKAAQARKEQLKREAREKEAFALSEVFVNSLNSNIKAGDNYGVAAGKALGAVVLAKGISKSLQYFEEGSEYVTQKGKKSPFSKGKDTVDAVVRVGEGIVTTEANQAYKGVVGAMNKGIFHELYTPKKVAVGVAESMANNVLLMQQMKANRLLEKIASKPSQMIEFDNFGNIIETVYRASIKERTTYKNSLSRFKK